MTIQMMTAAMKTARKTKNKKTKNQIRRRKTRTKTTPKKKKAAGDAAKVSRIQSETRKLLTAAKRTNLRRPINHQRCVVRACSFANAPREPNWFAMFCLPYMNA